MQKRTKRLLAAILAAAVSISAVPARAAVNSNTEKLQEETAAPAAQDNRTAEPAGTGWDGVATEDVYEGKNFRVTFTLAEHWEGGYNARVEIENTGDTTIENWMLGFSYAGSISNIWNAATSEKTADGYVIKNAAWNQDIEAGKSVSFGFSGQENFPGFPKEYRLKGSLESVPEKDHGVSYHVNSVWDNGFTGEIEIKNNTDKALEDWVLEFNFDRTITNIWNGVIESHEGNHYVIKNAGYNSNIPASGTVSFGFNGQDGKKGDEPSGYKLYSYTDSAAKADTEKDDTNKEDTDRKEAVTINTDGFTYNENADWYIVDKKTDTLSGTLSAPEKVKDLLCEVTDIKGNTVKSCGTDPVENWELENFGLSIGYNRVTVTATLETGEKVTAEVTLMNYESSNLDGIDADMTDSDGDGLCNYYEEILGTDKNKADTDGDGLKDGEEVIVYHTAPLVADTDKDGLNDREDLELKFDPTNPDTDGNGILDGKEKVLQTCTQKIDTDEKAGITEVSVTLACDGYIDNRVSIMDTYDLDMRSSDVVGLVGVPVEISTDVKFKTADITFTYDESALGDSKEEDLCMMWYDEENDNYVLLEDSVLDKENNTITYRTTHFSTYLVVDRQIWLDNLRAAPDYTDSAEKPHYDIAFVVDVSLSMGENNRLPLAKASLNAFIDAMLPGDRAGLVKFNREASVVRGLTEDRELLKAGVESLSLAYDNSVAAGIRAGLLMLDGAGEGKEKIMVLVCDGDVDDCTALVQEAGQKNVKIFCINVMDGDAGELEDIAKDTGGLYYYAATSEDIAQAVSDLQGDTIEAIDMTDSDGDGLYDVYETEGMLLSNGQVVYTNPDRADTDGDGVSDYEAMGGDPVTENYRVGEDTYSCTLFHSEIYGKLSKQFVYVDGKLNRNGKQYFGKMDYVPYSDDYLYKKYEKKTETYNMFDIDRAAKGDARIHRLFSDQLYRVGYQEMKSYAEFNSYVATAIAVSTYEPADSSFDPEALGCFLAFASGMGGDSKAWEPGYTRKNIDATRWILQPACNSAGQYYCSNMNKAVKAVESVLNKYNTEVYISVSPEKRMDGGIYFDTNDLSPATISSVVFNLAAYGTFNSTDAGVTLHCVYNPDTEEYTMDFKYCLIDYYDFTLLEQLNEQNMLGLASGYELYGYINDTRTWKKGEEKLFYNSWIEYLLERVNEKTR